MRLSTTLIRQLSITLLLIGSLFLAAACSEEPTPAPTTTPTATPVPTPTPSVDDFLAAVGASITGMETAKFGLIDETETGALFLGMTFKSMEAELETPSSVRMVVSVGASGFGFVEIEIIEVEEQAFLKLSEGAPWAPLPPDQVPFDFAGLGVVFATLQDTIQNVAMTGRETLEGNQTIRVEGVIPSEALLPLITSADSGHEVTLTLWIDETELVLRQARLAGQIYDADAPETTRLLTIEDINVPVDIELPDIASGQ